MPVLMNKGDNPRQAAWMFYTKAETFAELGHFIREQRLDAGVLVVDEEDLQAAKKASAEVPLYLQATTLVAEDVDLEALVAAGAQAASEEDAEDAGEDADESPFDEGEEAEAAGDAGESADDEAPAASAEDEANEPAAYATVPAPEGEPIRVRMGTTTLQAAQDFIQRTELNGEPWEPSLPGLQSLAQIALLMEEKNALTPFVIWHEDKDGIMRMAPAKAVKPMAGNVLKVKL